MKKNVLWLIMIVFVLSTVLAGCGSSNNTSGNTSSGGNTNTNSGNTNLEKTNSDKTEPEKAENFSVSLRHTQIGEAKQARLNILLDAVADAEAALPGVKFELEGINDEVHRFEKLRAEMAAGSPPIIFDLFGGADTQLYARENMLLELTTILTELEIFDDFIELGEFTVDGGIYGLPIGGFQEGYFYNEVVFKELGLTPPKTWEELENVAAKLKEAGKVPFAMASSGAWVPLMTANTLWSRYAGPEITAGFAQGTTQWNSPEMVAAFTKYKVWLDNGYFKEGELGLDYGEQRNQLITGEAGMMYDGSWASSVFTDPAQAGDLVGKVGYFPMPPVPGGVGDQTAVNAGFSNGYGFSAKADDNEKKAIKAFIKALYNEPMQLRGVLEDNVLPSMTLNSLDGVNKILTQVIETSNKANSAFLAFDALVQPEVNLAISDGIQELIGGITSPQKMLDNVQKVQEEANKNAE
jgi:raffinose/stachyose/melibiose transport system substrate-binding protein